MTEVNCCKDCKNRYVNPITRENCHNTCKTYLELKNKRNNDLLMMKRGKEMEILFNRKARIV